MLSDESIANRSSEFWGICCEGGKQYSQVVRQRFHMTMAALDPTVIPTSPVVSLMVNRGGCEYLLCSLKPGTLLQVNLNLYFDKGEKVTFSLVGKGKIHLSGYMIFENNESSTKKKESNKVPSSSSKSINEHKVNLADAVESDDSSDIQEISKDNKKVSIKKEVDNKNKKVKKTKDDDSDNDSEDEDLFDDLEDDSSSEDEDADEGTEDNKKDSNRLKSYKRLFSSLTQSDEEEEDESDSEDSDEDTKKTKKEIQNKKPKKENSEIVNKKSGKNTPVKVRSENVDESLKKSPKQDLLNSSIGRTPMPQKKILKENATTPAKAVTPKKVNFADIESSDEEKDKSLNLSPSKAIQPATPNSEGKKKKKKKKNKASPDVNNETSESPALPKGLSSASFNQKLPGGLEYEDVRIGSGPIAKKGKLVHVYYTGMLQNNKVFDSRERGTKPFSFKLGANQVIQGWDMAVEGMKVGGRRRMKIPPSLGYANARTGPIPPNSTLYFTVELKAVS